MLAKLLNLCLGRFGPFTNDDKNTLAFVCLLKDTLL